MNLIAKILGIDPTNMPTSITETKQNDYGVYHAGYRLEQEKSRFECPICEDRELVLVDNETAIPCQCKDRKAVSRRLKSSGLTDDQMEYSLENYKITDGNRGMFTGVRQYLKAWPDLINSNSRQKGFGLIGTPGIAKTELACIIAKNMLDKGIAVVFISSVELIAELKQAQFKKDEENIESKIDFLAKATALILDDIGKERATEWVQSMYYRLIDLRYRNNLLTGFTSNHSAGALEDWLGSYGPATVSRLLGMAKDYILVAEDEDWRVK